jgi:phosphatidylglycerophosphatase C
MKPIAVFDFDGTITSKDTLFVFIQHVKGKRALWIGLLLLSPWLVFNKAGFISGKRAKEKVLTFFFRGMELKIFNQHCQTFATIVAALVRPNVFQEINKHQQKQVLVIVVSASIENWIMPWAEQHGLLVLATKLEVIQGKVTGRISGENCNGPEKVLRIKEAFDLTQNEVIAAYGDTSGDHAMLALAKNKYYQYFKSI